MLLHAVDWLKLKLMPTAFRSYSESPFDGRIATSQRQVQAAIIRCLPQRGNGRNYYFRRSYRTLLIR
jgi:hypothetical protein